MRRGIKMLIVAVVALGTNFGLHAAFGWCRPNHWRNHHGHYRDGCNNNFHHGNTGCNHTNADPWNCTSVNSSTEEVRDSLLPK